jgi:hypothetical protein
VGDDDSITFYILKGEIMRDEKDEKEKKDECMMHERDSHGDPNLCCCYIVDTDGRYVDPCYRPAPDCC